MDATSELDELLRDLAPKTLGALARRYGQFHACEDAVQEALLAAAVQWRDDGVPANPYHWLMTVAMRRLTDQWRSEQSRRRREVTASTLVPLDEQLAPPPEHASPGDRDDTLTLLFLCCHPALSPASQVPLTLRAVGGLTTEQIARALLVPDATIGQRISRAKQRIKATGIPFQLPPAEEWMNRLRVVLQVLYLIFNEGYTASSGDQLHRPDLTREAIRLTRAVHRLLPDDAEVTGLLALMLLTEARRPARLRPDGSLVPLSEQDRDRWEQAYIKEGVGLVTEALTRGPVGPYQLQAAIAAVHSEAVRAEDTDWSEIVSLYRLLQRLAPNPMVTLNYAVAVAMVDGPRAGLDVLAGLETHAQLADHHRLHAVRAHLLEMAGDRAGAIDTYLRAAHGTTSVPEKRYLEARARELDD
jgi:RNA polymerase sigma factor (sigma-70 family)